MYAIIVTALFAAALYGNVVAFPQNWLVPSLAIFTSLCGVHLALASVLLFMLRRFADSLGIKKELQRIAGVLVVTLALCVGM